MKVKVIGAGSIGNYLSQAARRKMGALQVLAMNYRNLAAPGGLAC